MEILTALRLVGPVEIFSIVPEKKNSFVTINRPEHYGNSKNTPWYSHFKTGIPAISFLITNEFREIYSLNPDCIRSVHNHFYTRATDGKCNRKSLHKASRNMEWQWDVVWPIAFTYQESKRRAPIGCLHGAHPIKLRWYYCKCLRWTDFPSRYTASTDQILISYLYEQMSFTW